MTPLPTDPDGVREIGMPELGRIELTLGRQTKRGYLVANGTLRDLPTGSHLDPATGVFTWAPGPGYIGTYRLTFVNGTEQIPVDVTIRPAGTVDPTQGDVRMFIDAPATESDRDRWRSRLPAGRSTRRRRSAAGLMRCTCGRWPATRGLTRV